MPRNVNSDDRLAAIDAAVIAIAAEDGFAAVTIRAVAQRIGSSTSAVTHYVSSRDELLSSAIRREIGLRRVEAEEAMAGLDDRAALRAFVEWAVLGRDEHAHRLWLALVLGATSEPVLRAELDQFNAWWSRQIQDRIKKIRPTDSVVVVDLLNVLVDGLIIMAFDAGKPLSAGRRARLLDAVWRAAGL